MNNLKNFPEVYIQFVFYQIKLAELLPDLNMGVTEACFKQSGYIPIIKQLFIRSLKMGETNDRNSVKTSTEIWLKDCFIF